MKGNREDTLIGGTFQESGFTNAALGLRVAGVWSKELAIPY
jgi:hypothetical protein